MVVPVVTPPLPPPNKSEFWVVEWFHTQPEQYTEFLLPEDQKYMITSGFVAPEAHTLIWDGVKEKKPIVVKDGDRLKYWQDPEMKIDLYVNGGASATNTAPSNTLATATFTSSMNVLIINKEIGDPGKGFQLFPSDYLLAGPFAVPGLVKMDQINRTDFSSTTGYDTVILFMVNNALLSKAQTDELAKFVTDGGKLIIWDADSVSVPFGELTNEYNWLPNELKFTTSGPGPNGALGLGLQITEEDDLANLTTKFIDTNLLNTNGDAVGDANVVTTNGTDWCENMNGTNNVPVTGPTHMYSRPGGFAGSGLITYAAFDFDSAGSSPGGSGSGAELKKILRNELEVSNESYLPCTVHIGPGPKKQLVTLRLYGTFNEGPGNLTAIDPETGLRQENPGYTDPISPFYPQAPQAPRKDFVTFNPAIMEHNQGYPELLFHIRGATDVQEAREKVFQRMWYEKEWFKDDNKNGIWDVIVEDMNGNYVATISLDTWQAYFDANIPTSSNNGWRLREHNNPSDNPAGTPERLADTYAPAIKKEFTYMTLDDNTYPILVDHGSRIFIPMAHQGSSFGLDSFESITGGGKDYVTVESEQTLGMDIDGDSNMKPMGPDNIEVNGDESVVLVLKKHIDVGQTMQFFDNKVTLTRATMTPEGINYDVCDNEATPANTCTSDGLAPNNFKLYQRGASNGMGPFYVKLISVDSGGLGATIEVGRLFGETLANIGANQRWNQKAFIVQGVFYNVVAIKAEDDMFKYITFREKLPKEPIKLYGTHLHVWEPGPKNILPEMPPFNLVDHDIMPDVQTTWTWPIMKVPPKMENIPPMEIYYTNESKEPRFRGELKEIYAENKSFETLKEFWEVEWFHTQPEQYTEFVLPEVPEPGNLYLVTTGFRAPEAHTLIWDGNVSGEEKPMLTKDGDRLKFWFDPKDGRGLFINNTNGAVRIYGTFGEGPGDLNATDPDTNLKQENPGYTDPISPFYPQAPQAPRKDFVTFNPAMMEHNQGYPELLFYVDNNTVQEPMEKVFKRMWYEKEWFKDDNKNGIWEVIVEDMNGGYVATIPVDTWQAYFDANIPTSSNNGWRLREHNNPSDNPAGTPERLADTYAPAIKQEFTYMTLDSLTNPVLVDHGSRIFIPMANQGSGSGLNSFESIPGSGVKDAVTIESEQTLGMDIDGGGMKPMDPTGTDINGDESVVLVLKKHLNVGQTMQFFDNKVTLTGATGTPAGINYDVCDNEVTPANACTSDGLTPNNFNLYQRGSSNGMGPFYVKLKSVDLSGSGATIEVGRLFGKTLANIGANSRWNEKAFIVQGVFYNVVAIKAEDDMFKYITFREKLPKESIKLYGTHLVTWDHDTPLPEMPPFNLMNHDIMPDVQTTWTWPIVKVPPKMENIPPLDVMWTIEAKEPRFKGELKEIYAQNDTDALLSGPTPEPTATVTATATATATATVTVTATATVTVTATPPPLNGAALYASNCANCHGALANSTKLNRTALEINTAISTVPAMSNLSSLSQAQIQAIADALATTSATTSVSSSCTLSNGKTVDLNGDGIVDISDASKLILKWGTSDSASDLNGDGIIDISDASKLILNWGKGCT